MVFISIFLIKLVKMTVAACVKDGCVHGAAIKYAAGIFLQTAQQQHNPTQTVCSFLQESIIGCYYWHSVLCSAVNQILICIETPYQPEVTNDMGHV